MPKLETLVTVGGVVGIALTTPPSDTLILGLPLKAIVGAAMGSSLSSYQRWRAGKLKPIDLVGSFISAVATAVFIAPFLAVRLGLGTDGLTAFSFMIALIGANFVEAMSDGDVRSVVDALTARIAKIVNSK